MRLLHRPRCTKSREALAFLNEKEHDFTVVKYDETPLTKEEIIELTEILVDPIENLIRRKEKTFREKYQGTTLNKANVIKILTKNPELMERPILIHKDKAVIGRPTERVLEII